MVMSMTTEQRIKEILGYYTLFGKDETLQTYGIKEDTLRRYIDLGKNDHGVDVSEKSQYLSKIAKQFTTKELAAISHGGRLTPGQDKIPIVSFEGQRIRIGAMSDLHIGSIYTDDDHIFQAFEEFKKAGVDFVTIAGDITEGMSNRPGHVYELSDIGYASQRDHAINVLGQYDGQMFMIDGNHDRWFIKSNGALIVDDICRGIALAQFLGHDEGDISLKGRGTLRLWHGEDGNSYATSYRIQKVIEAFTGGEKPNVLFAGHTHKQIYMFDRHIHAYSMGSIQKQSRWMRSKRVPAHTGFWILDIWVNRNGVCKTSGTWHPFYS